MITERQFMEDKYAGGVWQEVCMPGVIVGMKLIKANGLVLLCLAPVSSGSSLGRAMAVHNGSAQWQRASRPAPLPQQAQPRGMRLLPASPLPRFPAGL